MGAWKAIWGPEQTELYRLDEDPGETTDLSMQYPDVLGGLKVFLPQTIEGEDVLADPTGLERESLRRLGYVDE